MAWLSLIDKNPLITANEKYSIAISADRGHYNDGGIMTGGCHELDCH